MTVSSPKPLPHFWHVWCWGDNFATVGILLGSADFGYFGDGIWYHPQKHAMFLWQLANAEFVFKHNVRIKEYHFNVRQHKPRKVKKIVDEAQLIRYVVECKQ